MMTLLAYQVPQCEKFQFYLGYRSYMHGPEGIDKVKVPDEHEEIFSYPELKNSSSFVGGYC
jgi:hypothetical protein